MSDTPTPRQAAQALRDIERTRARAGQSITYDDASGLVFIWAGIWAAANLLCGLEPRFAGSIWLGCAAAGVAGSIVLRRLRHRPPDPRPLICMAGMAIFITSVGFVSGFHKGEQIDALVSLLIGMAYFTVGVWKGVRFIAAGAALTALTLIGWFVAPDHFYFWMAASGGAVLALTGVWLTKA